MAGKLSMLESEAEALAEFCAWVRATFGPRVIALRLFGSKARGEATDESDIDVLVVVEGLTPEEGREIACHRGDLLTRHDVLIFISPFAVSRERFDALVRGERLIAREIQRDGIDL